MKTMKTTIFALLTLALMFTALPAMAQTTGVGVGAPAITVLSSALAAGATATIASLSSTTGITASTNTNPLYFSTGQQGQQWCLMDHEIVGIRTVVNSTTLQITRAAYGTPAAHSSGTVVICGPGGTWNPNTGSSTGVFLRDVPHGSCTPANNQYLPVVVAIFTQPDTAVLYNCQIGTGSATTNTWVPQTLPNENSAGLTRICAPPGLQTLSVLTTFGSSAAPFSVGTSTADAPAKWFYGTIQVPSTFLAAGISVLNGNNAVTDTIISALYRSDGQLLNSTPATTASGIWRFQDYAFTTGGKVLVTGPARYWIAVQGNGALASFSTVPLTPGATTAGLGAFIGMLGSTLNGTTGTIPNNLSNFTAGTGGIGIAANQLPTSLISGSAPIACLFGPTTQ